MTNWKHVAGWGDRVSEAAARLSKAAEGEDITKVLAEMNHVATILGDVAGELELDSSVGRAFATAGRALTQSMRFNRSATMRDDLVEAARAFQAATTKTASWDGPYAWMDDKMLRVWLVMESYGRVHHVTGDLTQAEKVLDKARSKLVAAQSWLGQEHFVYMDIGDIYVDGLKGGRNRMIMEFYARLNLAKGSEEEQDAVAEALGHSVTWKNAPPPTK